ncbi:von Willebrand factor type A domain-containing protein, partial [Escherichia coli]|uniref:von Willebrand factor type A domain-containing protein n=1 Tax=Escherichia coli TaxID=562 RepID=UPI001C5899BB
INENRFIDPLNTPLSTFGIDVDAASYSNVRRFINQGQLPPTDAVRIEEMINYFDYDYPQPSGNQPFSVNTELSVAPWNPQHRLLRI